MQIKEYTEKFNTIETLITENINLLEIAKTYCDANFDKSNEVSTLSSLISLLLKNQKKLSKDFDNAWFYLEQNYSKI